MQGHFITSLMYHISEQHKETTKGRQERDYKDTDERIIFLSQRNPFNLDPSLRSITSGVVASRTAVRFVGGTIQVDPQLLFQRFTIVAEGVWYEDPKTFLSTRCAGTLQLYSTPPFSLGKLTSQHWQTPFGPIQRPFKQLSLQETSSLSFCHGHVALLTMLFVPCIAIT